MKRKLLSVVVEGVNNPVPWSQPNYNQGTENYAVLHMRDWIVYNVAMDTTGYPVICETGTVVSIFGLILCFNNNNNLFRSSLSYMHRIRTILNVLLL